MTSSFMEVSASAKTPANAFIDTKINTDESSNLNLTGSEEGIYDIFSMDDVLYITGARVMYTKNFKDWTILDTLPSNGYISFATKDNMAIVGGHGIMIRILQSDSLIEN